MNDNRGMSIQQARALANDPKTSAGIMVRLANGYPEVWSELLANPSLPNDLRDWIGKAQNAPVVSVPVAAAPKSTKEVSRGRKRQGRFVRTIGLLIVPVLTVTGLWQAVEYLQKHRPPVGVVTMQTLDGVDGSPAWQHDLASGENSDCTQYSFGTVQQNQVVVLTQNDIAKSDCEKRKGIASTLELVDLSDGHSIWKIDLARELDWTDKWHKQLVEVPGLNEILVKFTDVNGSDAGGNTKSIDKDDDRKMKTIVPYNRLNGLITDPVIAKSNSQPIMQAPVLQVLAIPGNLKSVLVMTNGAKKDFRYAKYRSKRFSSPRWTIESDLRPVGGTPIIAQKLVLGRVEGDTPTAISLSSGKFVTWNGHAESKLYKIGNQAIEVLGDGVSEKATNIESQGGIDGHDITINGIDGRGNTTWSIKGKGYAISRDDSVTNPRNRAWYQRLFLVDGKNNQYVSLVDPSNGFSVWRTKISKERFEISRTTSGDRVAVYLYKRTQLESKSFAMLNLVDGSESAPMTISSKAVRVDGATSAYSILVDEPDRAEIIKNAEKGKVASLSRDDNSDKSRVCVQGIDNAGSSLSWKFTCNGNQHALRAGGAWILLDLTPGVEKFWPMKASK
ncbi:MAG: hypothetical protein RJA45_50 [Actinomycetota bacterium]|jgi:hypothetical protein